jgi:DNA-directed RNA polymerase I subunit RPA1
MDAEEENEEDANDEDILDEEDDKKASNKKNMYMNAMEVQAQIRLTWNKHPDLLNFVFGGGDWRSYFIRAIPVPPARFRPPMLLGNMSVENQQNAFLSKMLQLNDRIRTLLVESTSETQSERSKQLAFGAWIDLQTTVNCFMDSSKDPSAGVSQSNGIRQLLEKKEGIFRK